MYHHYCHLHRHRYHHYRHYYRHYYRRLCYHLHCNCYYHLYYHLSCYYYRFCLSLRFQVLDYLAAHRFAFLRHWDFRRFRLLPRRVHSTVYLEVNVFSIIIVFAFVSRFLTILLLALLFLIVGSFVVLIFFPLRYRRDSAPSQNLYEPGGKCGVSI